MKYIFLILVIFCTANAQSSADNPKTISEAVDSLLVNMNNQDKFLLKHTKQEKLVFFHFGLGTWIRNHFGLWGLNENLLNECAKIKSIERIHPDDASGLIIDSLWAKLQYIEMNQNVKKPITITSTQYKRELLEKLIKYFTYPKLAWKSGTDSNFDVFIETNVDSSIKNIKFSQIEKDLGFSYQTELSLKNNWNEIVNILPIIPKQIIQLEFEFDSFGKKYYEYSK